MLVRRAEVVPVECVARGYLSGSGWKDYRRTGGVCRIRLPAGLVESERLPAAIFTPTTKAVTGHDEPLTFEEMTKLIGGDLSDRLRGGPSACTRSPPNGPAARDPARRHQVRVRLRRRRAALVDEVLTPDSSRFWPADRYAEGGSQPSYDKQYVRDWLDASGWNHDPPRPTCRPTWSSRPRPATWRRTS